jgi:S-adenosylmethionine:tRNA ribosyltransferase-isomerase
MTPPSLSDFDYHLPPELIAQTAIEPRDAARLLCCDPAPAAGDAGVFHRQVRDLPELLQPGDLLVLNRTRVIPARLFGSKDSGGRVEVLLIHPLPADTADPDHPRPCWRAMVRGKVRAGTAITLTDGTEVRVQVTLENGERDIAFPPGCDVLSLCESIGHMPLPPYIDRADTDLDRERYQTVFGDRPASIAAPTASLHFTDELLARLDARGVARTFVHLAVGPGTFKPVQEEDITRHPMHAEHCECPQSAVDAIAACRARGGRVIAVGTTVVRTLETALRAEPDPGTMRAHEGWTQLYLYPPQTIRSVDGLLTNFHLPRSTLLMLVSCLLGTASAAGAGSQRLRALYAEAIRERYRFYSYGDAMLLLPGLTAGAGGR